jgi:hypothetical protein
VDWYREAHGALDVVLDDFIQDSSESYGKVNPRLWQQLDEILGFLHTWWDQADVQSAGNLSRSMSGRWIQAGPNPREHFHQLLDTSIRNSLGDILAGYQQSNQSSWIVDHGSEISRAISFTSPEEFNLEGEWAGRWGLPSRDGVGESIGGVTTFLRPDGSGERSGRPMSNVPLARDPVYPYDRPITYGTQRYRTADGPIESPQPNTAWEFVEMALENLEWGPGTDPLDPGAFSVFLDELEQVRDTEEKPIATPTQVQLIDRFISALDQKMGTNTYGSSRGIYSIYTDAKPQTLVRAKRSLEWYLDWFNNPNLNSELADKTKEDLYWTPEKLIKSQVSEFRRALVDYAVVTRRLRLEEISENVAVGDMGTDGLAPDELELDVLRSQFRRMFDDSLADVQGFDSPSLFVLLADLDPDFAAQTFAPEDDSEMASIYNAWGAHVVGPEEER